MTHDVELPTSPRYAKAQHYFGGCPECGDTNGYLNVGGNHWFVCDAHKTKWCVGYGLFSSWQEESESAWAANAAKLETMREVDPLPSPPVFPDGDETATLTRI